MNHNYNIEYYCTIAAGTDKAFIINHFMEFLFGKLIKIKLKTSSFFILSYSYILMLEQNIKNNKNSALIPQYTHKFLPNCILKGTLN